MYRGLTFSNATFAVCIGAFLLFFCIDFVSERLHKGYVAEQTVRTLTADLRYERLTSKRDIAEWNASVERRWALLHPKDPQKARRESAELMASLMEGR